MKGLRHNPMVRRIYKVKNPVKSFFCPLCQTSRSFTMGAHLTLKNYLQISLCTLLTTLAFWPLMHVRGAFSFFVYWTAFEWVRRSLYRQEVPCPHCGFDASWYKRDVKVARELVYSFWSEKQADTPQDDDANLNEEAKIEESIAEL